MIALAIILTTIILLALLRFGVRAEYSADGAVVKVRVGPLSVLIFPKKEKSREKKLKQAEGKKALKRAKKKSDKPKVKKPGDLKSFRYMMLPPSKGQIRQYRDRCGEVKAYAEKHGLLVKGEMGVLMDFAIRFAGVENLVYAAVEDPGYLEELLSMLWNWSVTRMEIALDERPDLFMRRGWYENMSFWSPAMFRRFMKPYLEKEALWAHQAGAKLGYINTCAYMPLIDDFLDIGIDVLTGVDPVQDTQLDMALLKEKTKGKICLWGGGNGFVTLERGTPGDIRREVYRSAGILAPGGGFILTPVDNVTPATDEVMGKVEVFLEAWKAIRTGHIPVDPA